jgi:threonine/homoserine/homoserine lactone efflux protein
MLALITIFCTSFVIALSGAMMPGPLLTATISETSRQGFKAGPLLILGHGFLELLLVLALVLGLAPFFQRQEVFIFTAFAGAIILAWMGVGMLRTLNNLHIDWKEKSARSSNHLIISGILLSIANPYWTIWWASIGLGYILYSQKFGIMGILFFFLGHIFADLTWYAVVSLAVDRGRHFLTDRLYRGVIGICASFLIVFACYFAYSGFQKIFT